MDCYKFFDNSNRFTTNESNYDNERIYNKEFYYYQTDAESALSILSDGIIYPKTQSGLFELNECVQLAERDPKFSDITMNIADKGFIDLDYFHLNY